MPPKYSLRNSTKRKKAAFEAAFYTPLLLVATIALPLCRPLAATVLEPGMPVGQRCVRGRRLR